MALPTFQELLTKTPLYEEIPFLDNDIEYLQKLVWLEITIDCFCSECNKESTFKKNINPDAPIYSAPFNMASGKVIERSPSVLFKETIGIGSRSINLYCTRNNNHRMFFLFYFTNATFIKIGQYPSIAEISKLDIDKYKHILGNEKYKEFNRSIGLVAHGVGIGAFVYLRRIFEDLVGEAYMKAKEEEGWDDDAYQKARMDEKIDFLRHFLPSFLVENKKLYGILSKGIHELSEKECLEYFPIIRGGIELILDEKIEAKMRAEKIASVKKDLEKIQADIKNEKK